MNKNVIISKQLINIAKVLIAYDLEAESLENQVKQLENQLDNESLQLFNDFKRNASIKTASDDESGKAKSMIKDALNKAKKLSGKTLKVFLLAVVAFIALHCNMAKAQVINLDDTNTLKNVARSLQNESQSEKSSSDFSIDKNSNLYKFLIRLSKKMSKSNKTALINAVNQYCSQHDVSKMKINQFIYKIQSQFNLTEAIQNALFETELDEAPIWTMNCK